jgi:membrane-associated protease RseP (regulator of RpoE activity)
MTTLLYTLGVVVFVLAILVSIGLHEFGHLIPAKRFGGKVTQWFVGFGRTVWSTRRGETEYGIKAIPLGGYVKIVGMLPPGKGDSAIDLDEDGRPVERVRGSSTGLFTQLVSDAREAEWEQIRPEDSGRLFYKLPWWKKVIVMAGGPTVNIAIAFFIFLGIFATYGERTLEVAEGPATVGQVSDCLIPYEESGRRCTPDDPATPAVEAGLEAGDVIVAFNGEQVADWEALQDEIRDNAGGDATMVVQRDGERLTLTTNTTVQARPTSADDETLTQVGFLGVSPALEERIQTGGVLFTLDRMGEMTVMTVQALGELPANVWDVAQAIVGLEERAADGPVSIVGGSRFAGETAATDVFDTQEKAVALLSLIAGFNLFIGLFNFVPLLPLDGGHIAGALYEGLRRGVARLLGRPDPGHVDVAKLLPVAYVAGFAILVMGLVLIVGDIIVPVSLPY